MNKAIEIAARDMGIVPGDPAYPFVRFMIGQADDLAQQQDGLLQRLDQVITEAKAVAGGDIARSAARELPQAIRDATWRQHRTGFLVAAGVLVVSIIVSFCSGALFGQYRESERAIDLRTAIGRALTTADASQWLTLMRLNDIADANRTCAQQAGGVACQFAFWTQRPVPK